MGNAICALPIAYNVAHNNIVINVLTILSLIKINNNVYLYAQIITLL